MVYEHIVKNIKDLLLADQVIQNFMTTRIVDCVAAPVTSMATLHFKYTFCLECALPRASPLGTVADWQALQSKIDQLPEFDLDVKLMSAWHGLLVPVFDTLVKFAEGTLDVSFWNLQKRLSNICTQKSSMTRRRRSQQLSTSYFHE